MKNVMTCALSFLAGGLVGLTSTGDDSRKLEYERGRLEVQREAVRLGLAAWDADPSIVGSRPLVWNHNAIRRVTDRELFGEASARPMLYAANSMSSLSGRDQTTLDQYDLQ